MEVRTRLESLLEQFENAWQRGQRPNLDDYLRVPEPERHALLIELVLRDLEFRLQAGEAARVEEYLCRYPELQTDTAALRKPSSAPPIPEWFAYAPAECSLR
jgi:hypothetical protein